MIWKWHTYAEVAHEWDPVERQLSEMGLNLHVKMHQNQAKFRDLKKKKKKEV